MLTTLDDLLGGHKPWDENKHKRDDHGKFTDKYGQNHAQQAATVAQIPHAHHPHFSGALAAMRPDPNSYAHEQDKYYYSMKLKAIDDVLAKAKNADDVISGLNGISIPHQRTKLWAYKSKLLEAHGAEPLVKPSKDGLAISKLKAVLAGKPAPIPQAAPPASLAAQETPLAAQPSAPALADPPEHYKKLAALAGADVNSPFGLPAHAHYLAIHNKYQALKAKYGPDDPDFVQKADQQAVQFEQAFAKAHNSHNKAEWADIIKTEQAKPDPADQVQSWQARKEWLQSLLSKAGDHLNKYPIYELKYKAEGKIAALQAAAQQAKAQEKAQAALEAHEAYSKQFKSSYKPLNVPAAEAAHAKASANYADLLQAVGQTEPGKLAEASGLVDMTKSHLESLKAKQETLSAVNNAVQTHNAVMQDQIGKLDGILGGYTGGIHPDPQAAYKSLLTSVELHGHWLNSLINKHGQMPSLLAAREAHSVHLTKMIAAQEKVSQAQTNFMMGGSPKPVDNNKLAPLSQASIAPAAGKSASLMAAEEAYKKAVDAKNALKGTDKQYPKKLAHKAFLAAAQKLAQERVNHSNGGKTPQNAGAQPAPPAFKYPTSATTNFVHTTQTPSGVAIKKLEAANPGLPDHIASLFQGIAPDHGLKNKDDFKKKMDALGQHFFKTNPWTASENASLSYYQGSGYGELNNYLRDRAKGQGEVKPHLEKHKENIQSAIMKSFLPADIKMRRGFKVPLNKVLGLPAGKEIKPGMHFEHSNFASVSWNSHTPENFASHSGTIMHFTMPKGSHGAIMKNQGWEGETVLPAHSVFRIDKVEKKGGQDHVHVTYLGVRQL